MNLENYEKFIDILTQDLLQIFEYQKEYIFCKEGCSLCCEKGEYPLTRIEFEYLKKGYELLPIETKKIISENIAKLKANPQKAYRCPFLINKRCSVYKHRAIICRTFGVLTKNVHDEITMPFCCEKGLNFSNLYDKQKGSLSFDLYKNGNFTNPPKPFNLTNSNIMELDLVKELGIEFGEVRTMIDWL